MRTTLSIDDDLLERAKRQALDLGVSVSEVVNRVLRRGLGTMEATPSQSQTLTYGDPEGRVVRWDDVRAEVALDDEAWLRRKAGR